MAAWINNNRVWFLVYLKAPQNRPDAWTKADFNGFFEFFLPGFLFQTFRCFLQHETN
jgi:hypothetical protein